MRWDAVLHPVGPLPVSAYWLRRAVALGGIVIVLILLRVVLGALGGGGSKPPTKIGAGVDIPTPTLSSAGTTAPSASPAAPAACADADLAVTISTEALSYPSGSLPQFVVTVTNTGAAPCTRDVGAKSTVITVVSGSDRIWSSGDCPVTSADVRTLVPNSPVKLTSSWDRDRSVVGCKTTGAAGQAARTGVYVASVKLGTLTAPVKASFHLS